MIQIILGSFGLCLIMGILLAEWKIYRVTIDSVNMKQSMRAIELLVEERVEEGIEEAELRELIEMELAERLKNTHTESDIEICDMEQRYLQIRMQEDLPFGGNFHEITLEKEIAW